MACALLWVSFGWPAISPACPGVRAFLPPLALPAPPQITLALLGLPVTLCAIAPLLRLCEVSPRTPTRMFYPMVPAQSMRCLSLFVSKLLRMAVLVVSSQLSLAVHLALRTGSRDYVVAALFCGLGLMLTSVPLSLTSIKWEKVCGAASPLCTPLRMFLLFPGFCVCRVGRRLWVSCASGSPCLRLRAPFGDVHLPDEQDCADRVQADCEADGPATTTHVHVPPHFFAPHAISGVVGGALLFAGAPSRL